MKNKILEVDNVSLHFPVKKFGHSAFVHAMDNVTFDLYRGEVLALVGESGSGKTTTAKVIAKLHSPNAGRILFDKRDIDQIILRKDLLKYRKSVQMIFQDPFASLNPTHTIREILERPFIIYRLASKNQLEEKIKGVLVKVGLEPPEQFINKFPHELSGGQRQRVNIARAIAVRPRLLLADEPTSMLDVSIRMSIMNMIKKFRDEEGISYLYITHDLAGARYIADRIAVMYAGMIMEIGPAEGVISKAYHPYTKLLRTAAPQPEKGFRKEKLTAIGDIPSLVNPPAGCRFHPRCPLVEEGCSRSIPELREADPGHLVRCIK